MDIKFKDMAEGAVPATEEEQKDFAFVILDMMDFYSERMEKDPKDEVARHAFSLLQSLWAFFEPDPEWIKEIGASHRGFMRKIAKEMRESHGDAKHKA